MKWLVEVTDTSDGHILGRYSMEAPDCRHAVERVRIYRKEPRATDLKVSLSEHGYVEHDVGFARAFAACPLTPKSVPPEVEVAPITAASPAAAARTAANNTTAGVAAPTANMRRPSPAAVTNAQRAAAAQPTKNGPKSWHPTQLSMERVREPEFTVLNEDQTFTPGVHDGWFHGAYLVDSGVDARALEVLLFARFRAGLARLDAITGQGSGQRCVDIEVYDTDVSNHTRTPIARLFWDETTQTPTIELPGYTSPHAVSLRTRRLLGLPDAGVPTR